MKISIAERLHPFSHALGTKFLVPHTSWVVQVFPTRLYFSDLKGEEAPFFLVLDIEGPMKEFTAELNLEQHLLCVFGRTRQGYLCYELRCQEGGIWLTLKKAPLAKMVFHRSLPSEEVALSQGEPKWICAVTPNNMPPSQERLSLGMHKAQDWDLMRRRLDWGELFPHWFCLSQLSLPTESSNNFSLLTACKEKIEQRDKEGVLEAFEHFFLAAFEGMLVPRYADTEHQGIVPSCTECVEGISPIPLLKESGALIRSLFIQENGEGISLLPCLPTAFHCGRMVGVKTSSNALLHLEWSKKALRRVVVEPRVAAEICLHLPKGIRSLRITCAQGSKKTLDVDARGWVSFPLEAGRKVQLDRFLT